MSLGGGKLIPLEKEERRGVKRTSNVVPSMEWRRNLLSPSEELVKGAAGGRNVIPPAQGGERKGEKVQTPNPLEEKKRCSHRQEKGIQVSCRTKRGKRGTAGKHVFAKGKKGGGKPVFLWGKRLPSGGRGKIASGKTKKEKSGGGGEKEKKTAPVARKGDGPNWGKREGE